MPTNQQETAMIDLHYWTTPNGHKISICLEEMRLAYKIVPVDISKDQQFTPAFLAIAPNNKIPAIVDHAPPDNGGPISLFESGAILTYLGEKTGKFLPKHPRGRAVVSQWLFWQVGGLGAMAGQLHFFQSLAPQHVPFAIARFEKEVNRIYAVLDKQLANHAFIAGPEYTIADMAAFTWAATYDMLQLRIEKYPHVRRWLDTIADRPAVKRAYAKAREINPAAPMPTLMK
jgi:GST-like protein